MKLFAACAMLLLCIGTSEPTLPDVLDSPSSPLAIESDSPSHYEVTNRSKSQVKAFRLACVKQGPEPSITFLFPPVKQPIEVGEARVALTAHGPLSTLAECAERESQLAVAEASTSDGGVWYLRIPGAQPVWACGPEM